VESILSHAVRHLRFSIELVVVDGLLSLKLSRVKMISKLGEEFEAPIPATWIGDHFLQSGNEGYPWKNTFNVDATSGALIFVFLRDVVIDPGNSSVVEKKTSASSPNGSLVVAPSRRQKYGDLILQIAELEIRIAFDGLVEELLRKQRGTLFGNSPKGGLFTDVPESTSSSNLNVDEPVSEPSWEATPLIANTMETPKLLVPFPSFNNTTNGDGNDDDGEAFVMMRVGYKGSVGAVAKGLGNPRIETSLQNILFNGPFDSLVRLIREVRLGRSVDDYRSTKEAEIDEVDPLLDKLEAKVHLGVDQKLLGTLLFDLDATATLDDDLHVNLSLPSTNPRPALMFADDIDLVSFVYELMQFLG